MDGALSPPVLESVFESRLPSSVRGLPGSPIQFVLPCPKLGSECRYLVLLFGDTTAQQWMAPSPKTRAHIHTHTWMGGNVTGRRAPEAAHPRPTDCRAEAQCGGPGVSGFVGMVPEFWGYSPLSLMPRNPPFKVTKCSYVGSLSMTESLVFHNHVSHFLAPVVELLTPWH